VNELRIDTWADFDRFASQRDGWAFRGQQDASWSLMSSLSRRLMRAAAHPAQWPQLEERAIRIFRRKAHIYLPDRTVLNGDLRCLAMMQHHGAPTRLLDFTKSPYVAAFFALEHATQEAAVYALNTPVLWSLPPAADARLTRKQIDPSVAGNFQRYFAANRYALIWFGEPVEMDRRLVAQSGLLVVPGLLDVALDGLLAAYESGEPLIERAVLHPRLRSEGMHALYRMNITQATLFPDLEGLARSIAQELDEIWPRGRLLQPEP
jgi:hypothetical protein